jgi:hypothetical protein
MSYFDMFCRSDPLRSGAGATEEFEKLYDRWYGRQFFLWPGTLLLLVGAIAVVTVVLSVLEGVHYLQDPLFKLPETAVAAVAGAYLWVVNDHIGRVRRLDFSPANVMWGIQRLVIAVPMGYAFSAIAAPTAAPFVAFSLGALPLTTIMTTLRRIASKKLDLDAGSDESKDDIAKLQGVNKHILERLANEDINTIPQIAYCDPVRMTMRSNSAFHFIIDCMNQALAWMYLEDTLDIIRPLGLRGAVEIKSLMDEFDAEVDSDPRIQKARELAAAVLSQISVLMNQSPETVRFAFRQIADDPYTKFLRKVWSWPDRAVGAGSALAPEPSARDE